MLVKMNKIKNYSQISVAIILYTDPESSVRKFAELVGFD